MKSESVVEESNEEVARLMLELKRFALPSFLLSSRFWTELCVGYCKDDDLRQRREDESTPIIF